MATKTKKNQEMTAKHAQAILAEMRHLWQEDPKNKATLEYRARLVKIVENAMSDPAYVDKRNSFIEAAWNRAKALAGNCRSGSVLNRAFFAEMDHLMRQEMANEQR